MVTISEAAVAKIKVFMADDADAQGLRVYVKGGGCHGFSYGMALETKIEEDDTVIEKNGIKVVIDSQSAPMLVGADIDYTDTLQGSGFAIKNPQAKSTCGCGSSFS